VREIIREAAGLPDHRVSALGIGGPQGSRCGTAKRTCRRRLSSGPPRPQPSRPGISFMPAKRDFPNRALQASPITWRGYRLPDGAIVAQSNQSASWWRARGWRPGGWWRSRWSMPATISSSSHQCGQISRPSWQCGHFS